MLTEKGTLPIGLEKDGKVHREFEIRPQLIHDAVDVLAEQGEVKTDNNAFFGACLIAKQLVRIGDISPVPVEDVLEMFEEDGRELRAAQARLTERLKSFRNEGETGAESSPGASGGGDSV